MATDDAFIYPNCGNGVIDPNEQCDPGMGSPQPCPSGPADCNVGEPCLPGVVEGKGCQAHCSYSPLKDNTPCPVPDGGVPGVCFKFACCTGCWDGPRCNSGSAGALCGLAGS